MGERVDSAFVGFADHIEMSTAVPIFVVPS